MSGMQERLRSEITENDAIIIKGLRQIAYWEQVNNKIYCLNSLVDHDVISGDFYSRSMLKIAKDDLHMEMS